MAEGEWWRGAVIYQIYPRSFQDSTGSGTGDLPGVTRRLGHVAELGADAIWLSPFFPSPMVDMGYDVSDHRGVDPSFGTMADFDALVARAHELGLKVVIDQVLSHSSDRHPFFQESRRSREGRYADWYVWADPRPDGSPPSNWQAIFGGPAWEWEPRRRQYYFHNFLREQPDFDFLNPQVQDWALDTLGFWLDHGVDGFRLDAVNHYVQDRLLRDNPPDPRAGPVPLRTYDMQLPLHTKNRPENLAFVERMRAFLDGRGAPVLLGEIGESHHAVERLAEYTAPGRLHMGYHSEMMGAAFTAGHFRREVETFFRLAPEGWPAWAFSNHDVARPVSRWAAHGADPNALAKLACALLLSLQGSACLYQGEELGLSDADLAYDEIVDPEGLAFWPENPGRDGCRTPMPWAAGEPNAGFSTAARTWLPVRSEHRARAVDAQAGDEGSVLAFHRRMLALRRGSRDLRLRGTRFLEAPEPVLAFVRGEGTLCAFNLGVSPTTARLDAPAQAELASDGTCASGGSVRLGPNGFLIGTLLAPEAKPRASTEAATDEPVRTLPTGRA